MSAGETVVLLLKVLIPVLLSATALALVFYYGRPEGGIRTRNGRRVYALYTLLGLVVMTNTIIISLSLADILSERVILISVIPLMLIGLGFLFYLLFISKAFVSKSEEPKSEEDGEEHSDNGE